MARLTRPVSQALQNVPGDVRYVQFLLNDWRRNKNLKTLVEDGIAGPLTSAAIREFQKAETGIVDGRIDVNGPAIRRLEYLHILRIANQVYVPTLEHYTILSMIPPALGPVTIPRLANRYLNALRKDQG
jgi:peptidoglycan hydrolase-like protein with peptidoglycan-binding domain